MESGHDTSLICHPHIFYKSMGGGGADAASFSTPFIRLSILEAMGIELSLFCCHIGDLELDSPVVRSTELGSSSSGSESTRVGYGTDSTERGSTVFESSWFVSSEYESSEPETTVSGRVEDVPLRQWWPMNDDRLLTNLYGSRCVLTGELVPRNSSVVMRTHPVLVSLRAISALGHNTDCCLDSRLYPQRVDPFSYPRF